MPVKRRMAKRRATFSPEVWTMVFESGCDYFDDLEPLGLIEPHRVMPGEEQEAAWEAAIRAAWADHGADYMRARDPSLAGQRLWALDEFGDPERMTNAG